MASELSSFVVKSLMLGLRPTSRSKINMAIEHVEQSPNYSPLFTSETKTAVNACLTLAHSAGHLYRRPARGGTSNPV